MTTKHYISWVEFRAPDFQIWSIIVFGMRNVQNTQTVRVGTRRVLNVADVSVRYDWTSIVKGLPSTILDTHFFEFL
jgi:hypothetical protein